MARIFVSYARADSETGGRSDGSYIKSFVDEVRREVQVRTRLEPDELFYLDIDVAPGETWLPTVVEAIRTCDVFLAFYSPNYFSRAFCGKEWDLFHRRLEQLEGRAGVRPPVLIPVLWVDQSRNSPFPEAAMKYQHGDRPLRDVVLRGRPREGYYRTAVVQLAEALTLHIHEVPTAAGELINPADAGDVEDAASVHVQASADRPVKKHAPGPRNVHFVVVAATDEEMSRRTDGVYGREPRYWKPYSPRDRHALARHAMHTALTTETLDLDAYSESITPDLEDFIDEKAALNELVVILVDPWTMQLSRYRDFVERYDKRLWMNTAVVVVHDEDDEQTAHGIDDLLVGVREVFPANCTGRLNVYREGIGTLPLFNNELQRVLLETQSQVLAMATKVRRIDPDRRPEPPPRLDGPSG